MKINETFQFSSINTFVNPYSWILLINNKQTMKGFNIYADGILVVWLHNLLHKSKINRFSFDDTSLAPIVFNEIIDNHMSLYLVGGEDNVMQEVSTLLKKKYPHLNIIGISSGFFLNTAHRENKLFEASKADIVICGMGTPYQENFLIDVKNKYNENIIGFTCGGYLDQLLEAGGKDYYPQFFDKYNIRWIYRLYKEPKRLWKRYAIYYPLFIYKYIWSVIKEKRKISK